MGKSAPWTTKRDLRKSHNSLKRTRHKTNLSTSQQQALQELKLMDNLTIKMSDKGGTVVLNSDNYKSAISKLLSDDTTYIKLGSNATGTYRIGLGGLIEERVKLGIITPSQADYILVDDPVIPIMHGLPKVHKGVIAPPMRPIISGICSLNENLCEWLDGILKPLVVKTLGYIQDTKDVLISFKNKMWKLELLWVSYDVDHSMRVFLIQLQSWHWILIFQKHHVILCNLRILCYR